MNIPITLTSDGSYSHVACVDSSNIQHYEDVIRMLEAYKEFTQWVYDNFPPYKLNQMVDGKEVNVFTIIKELLTKQKEKQNEQRTA